MSNNRWLIIKKVSNSWGRGYIIRADFDDLGVSAPEIAYYGYSKADAVRKYRQSHGLKGTHFQRLEINM